jgi:hypothetical protein
MFNIFKSKKQKLILDAEEHFKTVLRASKGIVALDVKQYPEKIVRLAEIFNEHNTNGLKILYNLKIKIDDNGDFEDKKYSYLTKYFPLNALSKKEYEKFEIVMMEAISGKHGNYNGV